MKHSLPITILLGAILSLGACGGTTAGNSSSEASLSSSDSLSSSSSNSLSSSSLVTSFSIDDFVEADGVFTTKINSDQSVYSLIGKVKAPAGLTWKLFYDVEGREEIVTKTLPCNFGSNYAYILLSDSNDVTAIYKINVYRYHLYTVTFDTEGGTGVLEQKVQEDSLVEVVSNPSKTGYTFIGWDYDFTQPVKGDMTIHAVWQTNEYTISFDAAGGHSEIVLKTVYFGQRLACEDGSLPTPVKRGYSFLGWQYNGERFYSVDYLYPNDATFVAAWEPLQYTIHYELDGGSNNGANPEYYTVESDEIRFLDPSKDGYSFVRWVDANSGETIIGVPKDSVGELWVKALWSEVVYNITYVLNNGTNNPTNPIRYCTTDTNIPLLDPSREFYDFLGWFIVGSDTQILSVSGDLRCDLTVYAKWQAHQYSITYDIPVGANHGTNPTSYTVESDDITFTAPVWGTVEFVKWVDEEGNEILGIPQGSHGDRKIKAVWREEQAVDPKWDVNFNQYGKEFMVTLGKLIVASGKVTSYADQKVVGPKAAAYPNEDSKTFIPFYKEPKAENVISASDFNTSTGWNREHTWPNSRGGGYFENDAVMVRPAAVKDNSNRGNKFYGLGGSEWDPADCGYEQARGEAARIILYCATAYNDDVSLSNNPGDASSEHTMGTLKTLLKWNRQYQPSEFEKTVNERLDKYGYRRNPFVDHPEYAEYIWDDNGLRTSKPEGGDIPSSSQTSVEPAATYNQVMDFSDLDGKQFAITASDGTHYYNMTSNAKSDKLPWYIIGDSCTYKDGVMSTECDIHWFTFNETAQDTYEITTTDGRYLYGYIAGTHYSIGLAKTDAEITAQQGGTAPSAISRQWKLEAGQNGTFQLTTAGVYLEYYNGSFCGYKSAPSNPLMLFA